jgi:membrane protein required for colicin V production
MQMYDIAMLTVLAAATLFGLWKGAAWQAASFASIAVSAMVAVHSSAAAAVYFPGPEPWNRFLAMLVLFVATALFIWILFRTVSGIIDHIQLKEFDRQLGGMIGFAKGILYCTILTFFAVTLSEPARQLVLVSRSGNIIANAVSEAYPVLPEDVRGYLAKYIDEFNAKMSEPPKTAANGSFGSQAVQAAKQASASNAAAAGGTSTEQKPLWKFW